jgi:hypothetical protein
LRATFSGLFTLEGGLRVVTFLATGLLLQGGMLTALLAVNVEQGACAENQDKNPQPDQQGLARHPDEQRHTQQHARGTEGQQGFQLIPVDLIAGFAAERNGSGEVQHQHERHDELEGQEVRQEWHRNQSGAEAGDAADEVGEKENQQCGR